MIMMKNKTTKRRMEINNYQILFDVVDILQAVNNIDSRVARIERQIKEINIEGDKSD